MLPLSTALGLLLLASLSIHSFAFKFNRLSTFGSKLQTRTVLGATTADFKNGMTFEVGNQAQLRLTIT
jgi:hypothetical protein